MQLSNSTTVNSRKLFKIIPASFNWSLFSNIVIAAMIILSGSSQAQTTIFSQDFSSSTTVSSYVSATPSNGQFNAITVAGSNTVTINGGALRFTRGNNSGSFTRSTDFSPVPTAIVYSMSVKISGTGGNQNSAATFQVGSGFNNGTNGVETNPYAEFSIDFRNGNRFRLRESGNASANFNDGSFNTITWAINNSGSTLSYTAPDGSTESTLNDKMDVWLGTSKIFDDVNVTTASGTITDLKFAFVSGTGTIDIDNINIYSINPFITAQPSSLTRCVGGSATYSVTASGTSLSYQWRKGTTNLSNGGSISGATTASLTINPIASGDAATDYNVVITSSGGYSATSNNTALTITAQPTITTSSAATTVCSSSSAQNSSLSYSATTNSPTNYTITWDAAAITAGLVNVGSSPLPASPITVPIAANVAAGTYTGTLTVSNAGGCSSSGNSFTITINASPTISGTLTACVGSTTQLTGSGTPAASLPWVSASTGIATVNSTGLVTGVAAGTSIITYTDINGCSKTATVTISAGPAATGITICQGGSGTLTSSALCPGGGTATSGPNNAGTGANNTAVGTGAWTTPGNITTTGTPYATQNLAAGATTNYLQASNYGFSIPSGATINGITLTIRKQVATTPNMFDNIVRIVKGGVVTGNNLASGTAWPNSFGITTYGSSSNLWGTTWTAADINASNFGVVLSATSGSGSTRQLDVDYIQVTVTYTTTGTLEWYTVSSGGSSIGTGSTFNPVGVSGSALPNFLCYVCSNSRLPHCCGFCY
ncbi:MAG: Ig-like domain-containing protein [Chitinophagaceae bacterium]|nr:Ig-like domain-containing protein [Chitinophagaceae bacterium]